jgi:hypothetical protein
MIAETKHRVELERARFEAEGMDVSLEVLKEKLARVSSPSPTDSPSKKKREQQSAFDDDFKVIKETNI